MVLGFDPRLQFVHEDDVVHALEHAALNRLPGTFNVAADGVLALSEAISLVGRRALPVLPPFGSGLLARPLRRLGLPDPDEMANLLRFGRGVDNRLLQGDRLRLRLHLARGRDPARRAHAPRADPARPRRRGGIRVRARGRGVPALEPARAPRARRARASPPTASRSGSEAPRLQARPGPGRNAEGALPTLHVALARKLPDSRRLPGRDPAARPRSARTRGIPRARTRSPTA